MKRLIVAAAIAVLSSTLAAAQPPAVVPQQTELTLDRYTLDVGIADLVTIIAGINELPKKTADPIANRLIQQIAAQNAAALKAKASPPPCTDPKGCAGGGGGAGGSPQAKPK